METNNRSLESFPPQYNLSVVDLSEYDPCKAILYAQLRFDIDTPNIRLDRPFVINLGTVRNNRQLKIEFD